MHASAPILQGRMDDRAAPTGRAASAAEWHQSRRYYRNYWFQAERGHTTVGDLRAHPCRPCSPELEIRHPVPAPHRGSSALSQGVGVMVLDYPPAPLPLSSSSKVSPTRDEGLVHAGRGKRATRSEHERTSVPECIWISDGDDLSLMDVDDSSCVEYVGDHPVNEASPLYVPMESGPVQGYQEVIETVGCD